MAVSDRNGVATTILFNAAALLVAAAKPGEPHEVAASFVDVPGSEIFFRRGLRIATVTELDQPLRADHLQSLTAEEQRDVAYHQLFSAP